MSDTDNREQKKLAEPYKSFPQAVAAIVRWLYDMGEPSVTIRYTWNIQSKESWAIRFEIDSMDENRFYQLNEAFEKTFGSFGRRLFIHHTSGMNWLIGEPLTWIGVGLGGGVNPKQDRSAKRLVRELPELLSANEAYSTVIADEEGSMYRLSILAPWFTVVDQLRVSWMRKLIGFEGEGLTLKFGAVRMPIEAFQESLPLNSPHRNGLTLLCHPWLKGTIEVQAAPGAHIPVPTDSAEKFDEDFSRDGFDLCVANAVMCSSVISHAILALGQVVYDAQWATCQGGFFRLEGHAYHIVCSLDVEGGGVDVLEETQVDADGTGHEMTINVTSGPFREISPDHKQVMQTVRWLLAGWIAHTRPEVSSHLESGNLRTADIWVSLGQQSRKRV